MGLKTKWKKPPIRVELINCIKNLLEHGKEISVERIISGYMTKKGTPRRLILECLDAVVGSGFAEYKLNKFNKKESIKKK